MTRDPTAGDARAPADRRAVAIVLHGTGANADAAHAWRALLAREIPDADVLDIGGHGDRIHARPLNDAAGRTAADRLLVCDASFPVDAAALAAVAACAPDAAAFAVAGLRNRSVPVRSTSDALYPEAVLSGADRQILADLGRACRAREGPPANECAWFPRSPVWTMPRARFLALGGLDDRLDGIGAEADLAARAQSAGLPVACIPAVGSPVQHLDDVSARFLTLRNRLTTAWKTEPVSALAPHLVALTAAAILAAWRSADLDPAAFEFVPRERPRQLGSRRPAMLPDETAALVPLLALDAFLTLAPDLAPDRAGLATTDGGASAAPPVHPAAPAGADDAGPRHLSPPSSRALSAIPGCRSGISANTASPPRVSVIVVNWNGEAFLRDCFSSLLESDYPAERLELICVDNGSDDGSTRLLRSAFPDVRVAALDENVGFTGGNQAGVLASTGDVLVFLNNDMRVAPDTVRRLVAALDDRYPCAAARVMSWDGRRLDFVGGSMSFEGRGYQEHFGKAPAPHLIAAPETFFPNGGAFAVTRDAYERCGGFDERYFAYYDDVDLGWRLRQSGAAIRLAADAVVWHRHGGTSGRHPGGKKRFLMERNAVWTVMKNADPDLLAPALAATLLLAVRRITQDLSIRPGSSLAARLAPYSGRCRPGALAAMLRPARSPTAGRAGDSTAREARALRRLRLESFAALGAAVAGAGPVLADRTIVQARRTVPDATVLAGAGRLFEYASSHASYRPVHDTVVEAMELPLRVKPRTRVLIVTHEPLQARLSGPGVRALELGRALARSVSVTVATPYPADVPAGGCTIAEYSFNSPHALRALADDADVLVVQGFTLARFPFLARGHWPVVIDLYCPFTLEHLEMTRGRAESTEASDVLRVQNEQLGVGDFFLCASERQRDFWVGALHTAGRINPLTYADDPTLRRLIDVVPFGLPADPPDALLQEGATGAPPVLKGAVPGIEPADRVLLWGGSMLDWQDPQVLIRAVAALARRRDDVKLFFVGTRHPNPQVPAMRVVDESIALARTLGILDTHVFFNDWVPYERRGLYLREADIGVSTHRDHLETRFAFRTRMLDYLWAGLPIVCTTGDHFADEVARAGAGLVVPPGDETALADALDRLLTDDGLYRTSAAAARALAVHLQWDQVVDPLRRFCLEPRFAADRAPAMRALHARLANSYRLTRWIKRVALGLGLRERTIEDVKQWRLTRTVMSARNAVALHRARRAARLRRP